MRILVATLTLIVSVAASASDDIAAPQNSGTFVGRLVVDVIEDLRSEGNEIAYSRQLVGPDLQVTVEPTSTGKLNQLLEILEQHDLTLESDAGVFLVVRKQTAADIDAPTESRGVQQAAIENITVSASRYDLSRDITTSEFRIDQHTIENMPDVGNDPVRIAQRLPGAAASGASARTHFRGGEESEVGVILNGHHLFDPYHIRDYQNVFSVIDSRAIDGVEVFTGGFPVRFGDRMSGLVVMDSMIAEKPRHTEIGVSVFNTSFLSVWNRDDSQWLVSARRGNLDQVIDDKFGRPSYYDVFAQFAMDVGTRSSISGNLLFADDDVTVVLESDPDEREEARSSTRNAQAWLVLDTEWSDQLLSRTALSFTDYSNRRIGATNDMAKVVSDVHDERDIRQVGLRQDWQYQPRQEHELQWGLALTRSTANYTYDATAEYFGLQAMYSGQPASIVRSLQASPDGASYAVYFADRWQLSDRLFTEWGLRWDDQTYTDLSSDSQLSPRASILYRWKPATDVRLSWGRYHQSQGIQELQVEDGVTNFWPAQRADHLILGLQHRFSDQLTMRIEAFHKDIQDLRPRFENLFDPLALIPELQADRVRLEPSSAKASGIEVSLAGGSSDWSWWASYTLSKTTDAIAGRDELRSWDQRHAGQAGVSWSNDAWKIALAGSLHTGWPSTDLELVAAGVDDEGMPAFEAIPGPRNERRNKTFSSVDFRVSRQFDVRRGRLTAFIEISNMLDRKNVCCTDWDVELSDDGEAELESSPDYWLPLLPAIGVLWEF